MAGEKLGNVIRKAREQKGWTQDKLASLCGVMKPQISKIEKNICHASVPLLLKVIDALGGEVAFIKKKDEEKKEAP